MSGLNASQQKIAETLNGMIVVDAGPGTGKTFTVVRRCINILRQKDFDWHDLIMLTFTKNAAAEMRERLQSAIARMLTDGKIDAEEHKRLDTLAKKITVGTFDSFCLSVVKQSPYEITKFFRFKEFLTRKADITENDSINKEYFQRFFDRFMQFRGEDFGKWSMLLADKALPVYDLLNRLMARGIVPFRKAANGKYPWFGGNDGAILKGDEDEVRKLLDNPGRINDPADFRDYPELNGCDLSLSPIPDEFLDAAAYEDRQGLIDLIHEIYYDYIRTCVKDDHLTFGLVACFAFIVLYNDAKTRERVSAKYLIVDEFQDTNSNQLMISMLVLKEPNLCVVGDWKQGIYGFRFVSIENITQFEDKLVRYRRFLNEDIDRIHFQIPETVTLSLTENYRSSQTVIDAGYESLRIKGSNDDVIDPELVKKITPIESKREEIGEYTKVECVQCESKRDEVDEVLRRIDAYIGSGKYMIVDGENSEPRPPTYRDIAILCRNGNLCRSILDACQEKGIPAFLQGDVDIMNTREGKILLAWLRYVSNDKDPWGITAILAEMNYPAEQIPWMIYDREEKKDHLPQELKDFRKHLRGKRRRITELISEIFGYYGIDNNISQAITALLSSSHRSSLQTISGLISTIESDMTNRTMHDIDGIPESDALIIQTLHKSKGLEYPIVMIPGMDTNSFPNVRDTDVIKFTDLMGIRCTYDVVEFGGEVKVGPSWKTRLVKSRISSDYNEERRLLFVGITRARQYVTLIAGPKPSQFFKHYAAKGTQRQGTDEVPYRSAPSEEPQPRPEIGRFRSRRKNLSAHDLLRFGTLSSGLRPEGECDELCHKGMKYGTEVHQMAELYIRGRPVPEERFTEYPELIKVKATVDRLRAEGATLYAERHCSLALSDPDVTVSGIMDLMAEFPDRIEIHDWKTDAEGDYQAEYRIQLSIYAHILKKVVPEKRVVCVIDWLNFGGPETFEPSDIGVIRERARSALGLDR